MSTLTVTSNAPPGSQWLRVYRLAVTSVNEVIDLSDLKFSFDIFMNDTETLNYATIRVYNVATATLQKILAEFAVVWLEVGYEGAQNMATIFRGNIKQFKRGRESATDTFLEIGAADGDFGYNSGVASGSFPAGSTLLQRAQALAASLGSEVDTSNPLAMGALNSNGGILPRPRVAAGMARAELRVIAETAFCRWSIQNGKVTFTPLDRASIVPVVVFNSLTGLIGTPEATPDGITLRTLLNPLVVVGSTIQINNAALNAAQGNDAITTVTAPGGGTMIQNFPDLDVVSFYASTNEDGLYTVIDMHLFGDTRANDWYADLTALAIQAGGTVYSNGGPNGST